MARQYQFTLSEEDYDELTNIISRRVEWCKRQIIETNYEPTVIDYANRMRVADKLWDTLISSRVIVDEEDEDV